MTNRGMNPIGWLPEEARSSEQRFNTLVNEHLHQLKVHHQITERLIDLLEEQVSTNRQIPPDTGSPALS